MQFILTKIKVRLTRTGCNSIILLLSEKKLRFLLDFRARLTLRLNNFSINYHRLLSKHKLPRGDRELLFGSALER